MERKYGFIGCGNMGGALAQAAIKSGKDIYAADRHPEKLAAISGAKAVSASELAAQCDMIFLGVKPQAMEAMFLEIKDFLRPGTVLVSMAAGLTTEFIRSLAGNFPVIRIMPNLPVSVGEGMILYCLNGVSEEEEKEFLEVSSRAGSLIRLDEKLIDAGSAVSVCGPAFAFMFIEALADGGVSCGLPRSAAQTLAAQTLLGSARLLLESGKHPGELKDAVCSPGGTTIAGVKNLEDGAFRALAAGAVISAYERTLELKK